MTDHQYEGSLLGTRYDVSLLSCLGPWVRPRGISCPTTQSPNWGEFEKESPL